MPKKFEPFVLKNRWGVNNKERDAAQSSQAKGKETIAIKLFRETPSKPKRSSSNSNPKFKFPQKQYSFKDEQVVTIFHLLNKGDKLKLPTVRRPDELGHTNDPNYYLFHMMVHHPTSRCFVFKDKIQPLVDAGVLTLRSEQKKVTANMVTFNFRNFPKVTVQDGLTPSRKGN